MNFLEMLKKQSQQGGRTPPPSQNGRFDFASSPFPSSPSAPQSSGLPPRSRSDIVAPQPAPAPQQPDMMGPQELMGPTRDLAGPMGMGAFEQQGPPISSDQLVDVSVPERERRSPLIDKPFYKDGDRMSMLLSGLSEGFGGMTLRGKSGMGAMNKATFADARKNIKDNKTYEYLVKNNPEMAKVLAEIPPEYRGQYMELAMKSKFGLDKQFRTQVSALHTDEKTGQKYYLESDGNGNQQIIYAKDADGNPLYGDTGTARQDRDIFTAGVTQARAAGTKFFEKSESLKSSLDTFKQARIALDKGARSGIIDSALPALDANTQNLRSLANTAGIEVINSATFGALSEKELALAMSTGIPTSLPEDQLDAYLDAKIKAQEKLYDEISKKAQQLNTGDKTLGGWQEHWANEKRPETYNDEYARRFGTDDMNTSYKGWRSEEDEDGKPERKKRWDYVD